MLDGKKSPVTIRRSDTRGDEVIKTKANAVCLMFFLMALTGQATAQPLNTLAYFQGTNGANPQAPLLASGTMLYGTTFAGGISNVGTVFGFNTATHVLNTIYTFTNGNDGRNPEAGLAMSGNILYGTTSVGGPQGSGTLFAYNLTSNTFASIYNFNGGQNGGNPEAGLLLVGNALYGTTFLGGTGLGTVFRINIDGTAYTNLHVFTGGTNGSNPQSTLILSGNTLYGTSYGPYPSGSGYGTVFKINTDGHNFSNVYVFTGGNDGANPAAGLILSGNMLYGTAYNGGDEGLGTVFSVSTNGGSFQSYSFDFDDGANPQSGLTLVGSTLYGTTTGGGEWTWGGIFSLGTDGSNLTNLYSFTDDGDGATPEAGLTLVGSTFYGTTHDQTDYSEGTLFGLAAMNYSISLGYSLQNGKLVLTWSNSGFSLLSSTNVRGVAYTNVSGAMSPYTNNLAGKVRFFELKGN